MEREILRTTVRRIRENRPFFPDGKICDVFYSHDLVEIGFLSQRCRRDLGGSCIMCDYGAARGTYAVERYIKEMDDILNGLDDTIKTLLLCTNGSFLDDGQIAPSLFEAVLQRARQSHIPTIEIETHYQDVTKEKLDYVKKLLPDKRIVIEMGLETVNPQYQSLVIMKGIDLARYEDTIALIQDYGFGIDVNIMIGVPFLSAKEQFEDAVATVQWAFARRCEPVLFPMNIKPYTLLMDMYKAGFYQPISQWMLPLILDTMTEDQLEKTNIAWYGNREAIYNPAGERVVFPQACPACTEAVRNFYQRFLTVRNGHDRKAILHRILSPRSCGCLREARTKVAENHTISFEQRYTAYTSHLAAMTSEQKECVL